MVFFSVHLGLMSKLLHTKNDITLYEQCHSSRITSPTYVIKNQTLLLFVHEAALTFLTKATCRPLNLEV